MRNFLAVCVGERRVEVGSEFERFGEDATTEGTRTNWLRAKKSSCWRLDISLAEGTEWLSIRELRGEGIQMPAGVKTETPAASPDARNKAPKALEESEKAGVHTAGDPGAAGDIRYETRPLQLVELTKKTDSDKSEIK